MTWEGLTPPYRTIVADPAWSSKSDTTRAFGKRGMAEVQPESQGTGIRKGGIVTLDYLAESRKHCGRFHLLAWIAKTELVEHCGDETFWHSVYWSTAPGWPRRVCRRCGREFLNVGA